MLKSKLGLRPWLSKELFQFERALDRSFSSDDVGDTPPAVTDKTPQPEVKTAKAPAVLKVTLTKNQVKLNSNYFVGKENSMPLADGKIIKINSSNIVPAAKKPEGEEQVIKVVQKE